MILQPINLFLYVIYVFRENDHAPPSVGSVTPASPASSLRNVIWCMDGCTMHNGRMVEMFEEPVEEQVSVLNLKKVCTKFNKLRHRVKH